MDTLVEQGAADRRGVVRESVFEEYETRLPGAVVEMLQRRQRYLAQARLVPGLSSSVMVHPHTRVSVTPSGRSPSAGRLTW
jgi:hypothetical protein